MGGDYKPVVPQEVWMLWCRESGEFMKDKNNETFYAFTDFASARDFCHMRCDLSRTGCYPVRVK